MFDILKVNRLRVFKTIPFTSEFQSNMACWDVFLSFVTQQKIDGHEKIVTKVSCLGNEEEKK